MLGRKKISILVGNTAQKKTQDPKAAKQYWNWQMYVKCKEGNESDVIKSVQFELHETYRDPIRTVSKAPFELKT